MKDRELMQQALEALVTCCAEEWRTLNNFGMKQVYDEKKVNAAVAALRAALAEPEQEPVAWWDGNSKFAIPKAKDWDKRTGGTTAFGCDIPLYTAPTPRTWVGLTEEEIKECFAITPDLFLPWHIYKRVEAALKEKNNG